MTFDAETVAAWTELPAAELRIQAQRLASARLAADHPVWRHIRKNPTLAAKLRGALSGLLTTIKGSRDEHMQRIWINAARNALSDRVAAQAAAPAVPAAAAETKAEQEKPQTPAPRVEQEIVVQEEKPKASSSVAPMLFQQPGKTTGDLS